MLPIMTCEALFPFNFKNTEKESSKVSFKKRLRLMYLFLLADEVDFCKTVFPVNRQIMTSSSSDSRIGAEYGGWTKSRKFLGRSMKKTLEVSFRYVQHFHF